MSDTKIINGKKFFSTKIAAQRLGKNTAYISKQCREGKLSAKKVGNNWFIELPNDHPIKKTVKAKTVKKSSTHTVKKNQPIKKSEVLAIQVPRWSPLPVAYSRVLPMVVGVVTALILFFQIPLPFLEQSLASISNVSRPFTTLTIHTQKVVSHTTGKTQELFEQASLSAAIGAVSLGKELTSLRREDPVEKGPERLAALGRSLQHTKRKSSSTPVIHHVHVTVAAVQSLYGFERVRESQMFWGASVHGVGDHLLCFLQLKSCNQELE